MPMDDLEIDYGEGVAPVVVDDDRPFMYGYCRVSTKDQDTECLSQKAIIKQQYDALYSAQYQWGGFYVDAAVSGTQNFADRAAGRVLLERLEEGDAIIGSKLDRLSRNLADFADLLRVLTALRVSVVAQDMGLSTITSVGRLVAHILVAIGEWERERFRERSAEGREMSRQLGYAQGGPPPYGFYKTGKKERMIPNPVEQSFIRQVHDWHSAGNSMQSILRYLNGAGILCPRKHRPINYKDVIRYIVAWTRLVGTEFDVTDDSGYTCHPFNNTYEIRFADELKAASCRASMPTTTASPNLIADPPSVPAGD